MKTLAITALAIVCLVSQGFAQSSTHDHRHHPDGSSNAGDHHSTFGSHVPIGSNGHLREVDRLAMSLLDYSRALHDKHHHFLEGQYHADKLDRDVTSLERAAQALHAFALSSDGSSQSMDRLRRDSTEFLQLSFRISRTIDLTEPWLRGGHAREGIRRMRGIARNITNTAIRLDAYLPTDTRLIDDQTADLESAVKKLHDEFHDHLEGYEVSTHLDQDLEELETLVKHIHQLAHNKTWAQMNLGHLMRDLAQIQQETTHIESLFVQQSRIGTRPGDMIGIEHARDAITDILASVYVLEHMIQKTGLPRRDSHQRSDRWGHELRTIQRYGH